MVKRTIEARPTRTGRPTIRAQVEEIAKTAVEARVGKAVSLAAARKKTRRTGAEVAIREAAAVAAVLGVLGAARAVRSAAKPPELRKELLLRL